MDQSEPTDSEAKKHSGGLLLGCWPNDIIGAIGKFEEYYCRPYRAEKQNGTTILIVVPPQHKHKIKHDKTTMQSTCQCRGDISSYFSIFTYIKTTSGRFAPYKQMIYTICFS